MHLFEAYLGASTTGRVGAQHVLNAEYFKRIDALNYTTMLHDDGQHVEGLDDADVVLVEVSVPPRRRPRSISPTAVSAPPMFRWCRAFPCRISSNI